MSEKAQKSVPNNKSRSKKQQKQQQQREEEASLLLRVEQVKYRKAGPGKSPLGTFCVYEDRVEWTSDVEQADQLLVHFSKVKGQRISPPNKPKVQLQLCMLNDDDQATFVFMNGAHSQEQLLQERDMVKETLQQALVRYRQLVNQMAQKAARGGTDKEQAAKVKILEQNAQLHELYVHLVKSKLISPQDFWSFHYKTDEKSAQEEEERQQVGISGGFLSSIVQSEGIGGGIKLNLTNDTIQSIFRTYPAVERKHLELVPHELSEQEFWSRFFQSHYFHRERNPAEPSTSAQAQDTTFADCVQMDEKDMADIIEKGRAGLKRHLDLTYINEDRGILSDMRSVQISLRGSTEAKRLLVRRCNYHSERVLSTMDGDGTGTQPAAVPARNGTVENGTSPGQVKNGLATSSSSSAVANAGPSTSSVPADEAGFDLELESHELAEMDRPRQEYTPLSAYNPPKPTKLAPTAEQVANAKRVVEQALGSSMGSVLEESNQIAFFNVLTTNSLDELDQRLAQQQDPAVSAALAFQGLGRMDVERIRTVHACLAELLRHFWQCFPPRTPQMEQKIFRMDETLTKFEQNQLAECEERYGAIYVQHCKEMLALARQRFRAFSAAQQKR